MKITTYICRDKGIWRTVSDYFDFLVDVGFQAMDFVFDPDGYEEWTPRSR
jgi:hypothetical protein